MDVSMARRRSSKTKDTNLSVTWSEFFWPSDVFLCNGIVAWNSSFDSPSFTMSSYIATAFFIISFLDARRPSLRLLRIDSRTNSFNFFLKGFLAAFLIPVHLLPFNFFFFAVFRWGTHLSMYVFCPSVCLSVAHHIWGTVHHLIIIFGTHVWKEDISRCFSIFLKFWSLGSLGA